MNIIILTQDDPFYLADNLEYFTARLPAYVQVRAAVVFDASPFGKKEGMAAKMKRTINVFGWPFFIRYSTRFLMTRLARRPRVEDVFQQRHIPVLRLTESINSPNSIASLRRYEPDLLVSIAANELFKSSLLSVAPKGCINLHSGMLPKYRGLMPTFWALRNGEPQIGVSVFFVEDGIDSGPLIVQKRVDTEDKSLEQLIVASKRVGMDALVEAVEKIHNGSYELIVNDSRHKSYYSFPTRADVRAFLAAGRRLY